MGCDEQLACGGGAVPKVGRTGVMHIGFAGGIRDAGVCWWLAGRRRRCHGFVTSGAKHGGAQGDTLRRFVQVGGRGGTSWDG